MLSHDTEKLVERIARAAVEIGGSRGHGAGVRWPVRGLIATCSHVVADRVSRARLYDGRELPARLLLDDAESDVALLFVDDVDDLPPLDLRREPLRPGELLFAMGNPWGEARVLSAGVAIGAAARPGLIAADLRVMPGNSGGPLIDARGRLAGIVSMYHGGAALAVPVERVARLVARLEGPAAGQA